jgi:hypothetical protein
MSYEILKFTEITIKQIDDKVKQLEDAWERELLSRTTSTAGCVGKLQVCSPLVDTSQT